MKTFIVSEKESFMKLLSDMSKTTSLVLSEKGIDTTWLTFARPIEYGYKMALWKDRQWELLAAIVEDVYVRNQMYKRGEIADILGMLINNTVKEYMSKKNIGIQLPLPKDIQNHLQTQLINIVDSTQYIPRYPWLVAQDVIDEYSWTAFDASINALLKVQKSTTNKLCQYELHYQEAPTYIFV